MPDTFGLSSSLSILTGVILPLFSILSFQAASAIYQRWLRNDMTCAAVIFSAGCISALVLYLTNAGSMALTILCLALLVGCMHGVNFVLICMVPPYFAGYGRVSLVSGILNSCTYVGSALSTYGIAVFSQLFGWQATIGLWAIIAALGMGICVALTRKWQRFANH